MAERIKRKAEDEEHQSGLDFVERLGEKSSKGGSDRKTSAEEAEETLRPGLDFVEQLGEDDPAKKERREKRLERAKERREKAGNGLSKRGAAAVAGWAAGGVVAGGLWTLGKALEYALLGWELDSNGWPKIDKQSIAHVEKWHNKVAGIKG